MSGESGFTDLGYGDPLAQVLGEGELREGGGLDSGVVLTPEVTRQVALLAPWLKERQHFLLVGRAGGRQGLVGALPHQLWCYRYGQQSPARLL